MAKGGNTQDDYVSAYPTSPNTATAAPTVPTTNPQTGTAVAPLPAPSGTGIYGQSADWLNQSGAWNAAAGMATAAGAQPIYEGMPNYQNVFDNAVVNAYGDDLYNQTQRQLMGVGADANSAGAFGGSRHGLVEGQVYDAAQRNFSDFSSNLRRQGFLDAGNFANMDIQNMLNSGGSMLDVANAFNNLSQTGFNMGTSIGQQQWQQGLLAQMMNQNLLDDQQAQFNEYVNAPATSVGLLSGVGSASPLGNTGTTDATTTPGLYDYLSMGAQLVPFIP